MKKLSRLLNNYHLERLVWCIAVAAFCWTDVADYYPMKYNKIICVWIGLGCYYVYKKGLLDGDYGFSTAVGLFNTVINVILLISMNTLVKRMNDGKGI